MASNFGMTRENRAEFNPIVDNQVAPILQSDYQTARFETTDAARIHAHMGIKVSTELLNKIYESNGGAQDTNALLDWVKM